MTSTPSRSIVVPAFDEEHRIVGALVPLLAVIDDSTEVIVVDDGSTDATAAVARRNLRTGIDRVITLQANSGKGAAVMAGLREARGEQLAFVDADGATDIEALPRLFAALDSADLAIGSRSASGAVIEQHPSRVREYGGRAFNAALRAATRLDYRDTQCGFKAMRASAFQTVQPLLRTAGFMFDVELLLAARHCSLATVEVPVRWHAVAGSKVRPFSVAVSGLVEVARAQRRIARASRAMVSGPS